MNVAKAAQNPHPYATHRESMLQCCNSGHVPVMLKAATTPLARTMDLLHWCVEGDRLCPDLKHVVDLLGVVHQDKGQRPGGLMEEWSEEMQCRRSYGSKVDKVMSYAMVFVVKQHGVHVAVVWRGHRVMRKMMAYAALRVALAKVLTKEQIKILN